MIRADEAGKLQSKQRNRAVFERQDEAHQLATRFVNVWRSVVKMIRFKMPDPVLEKLNITHLRALEMIREVPGITQKEIGEHLEIKPSSVSVAIRQLEDQELIERQPDDDDGRIMRLYLARRGQRMVHKIQEAQVKHVTDFLGALPIEDQRMVVEALERAVAARQSHMLDRVEIEVQEVQDPHMEAHD